MNSKLRTQLDDGEKVIRTESGGPIKWGFTGSGFVHLTNKRVIHEALKFAGGKITVWKLDEITKAEIRPFKTILNMLSFIFPMCKCITFFKEAGESLRLDTHNRDEFYVAIENALKK